MVRRPQTRRPPHHQKCARAWNLGNVGRTQELVEARRPRPGQEDLRGFEWRHLWRLCQEDVRLTLRGHQAPVPSVAISPDGTMLASASDDGTVKLWELASGQLVRTLAGQPGLLHGVRFSPDGKTLASGGSDGSIWLWDPTSGRHTASLRAADQDIFHVAFAPDGRTLASVGWSHVGVEVNWVTLWDLSSRREIARLRSDSRARGVAFSPDGRSLAFTEAGWIKLWDRAAKRIVAASPICAREVNGLAFSPDGKTIAWGDGTGTVGLWDVVTRREVTRMRGHEAPVSGTVVFSPDGKTLATCSDDLSIRLWDVATKRERSVLRGHAQFIMDLAFSPDGQTLASASADRTVRLWKATPRHEVETFGIPRRNGGPLTVAFSRDGRLLALGDRKKGVWLWEIATGRIVGALTASRSESRSLAFSSDGKLLACGGADGKITFWDLSSRHRIAELRGRSESVTAVAFSPDGRFFAARCWGTDPPAQGEVRVWALPTRRMIATLPNTDLFSEAFSPDGQLLVAVSAGYRMVSRWEVATWRPLPPLRQERGYLQRGAAFSSDGRLLASGDMGGGVYVWDVRTGRAVTNVQAHRADVLSLAFSPDGKTLATGSRDRTVKLWNVGTWQEIGVLSRPRDDTALVTTVGERAQGIVSVAFSPDGDRLVSVGSDGRVWLWRAASFAETDDPDGARRQASP